MSARSFSVTGNRLDAMKAEAAKFVIQPGEAEPERTRRRVEASLENLASYLTMRRWGYARSESIVAGPPPSPYLAHLL